MSVSNLERLQKSVESAWLDGMLLMNGKNIFYATGFMPTDSAAVITPSKAYLITDSRYIEAATAQCVPGVEVLLADRDNPVLRRIGALCEALSLRRLGAEEEYLSFALYTNIEETLGINLVPSQSVIAALRQSKTESELESLIAAQRISEAALRDVLPMIKPGVSERAIAAELTYRMLLHGAEGNSFDPIVVTGAKGSLPHGVPGDELIESGSFVTMDFGCIKNGYCSDMTRTVAVGNVSEEMRNVYEVVLLAQLTGIAAAKPGVIGADIHNAAAAVIAEAGYGEYFGHGFGHGVGLDVHEIPRAAPANKLPMPEGAVISAEPGIYIPGRFGVRIEDVLYLTGDGNIDLAKAPKELIIL